MMNLWKVVRALASACQRYVSLALPALIALGVVIAMIGIWWPGPRWVWGGHTPLAEVSMRISASVLVLFVPLIVWALLVFRRQQQWRLEQQTAAYLADPDLKEVELQQLALDQSLAALRGKLGHGDIYQLPWYLVLGHREAGKSSLISSLQQEESLLNLSSQPGNPDFSNSETVQWWLGHEALLIDTPGEFISQPLAQGEEESQKKIHARLWEHFLGWLEGNRSRRPLNGVVWMVDLTRLLSQTQQESNEEAQAVRARLDELARQLGARLPLYVVFSKIDLLEGFDEFFSRLPVSVRQEVLGFTFSLSSIDKRNAWADEFQRQYEQFIVRFTEQIMDASSGPNREQERPRLLALIRQLSGIRNVLNVFLLAALGNDRHTLLALVRGVYFTSAVQKGLLLKTFATQAKPVGAAQVYFTQQLFQRVIYPEAGLAGDNVRVARSKRRLLITGSCVAGLGCLLVIGGWQHYFGINRDKAANVLNKSRDFSARDIDVSIDATGRNLLAPLDQIRDAVSVYGDYREAWPLLSDMGLYQGPAIGPTVDTAYLNLLSKRFLPAIASGALEAINAAPPGSNQQLAALRVYRMIEERQNRRPAMVEEWVAKQWQRAYPGQGQLQADLMRHLSYALKYADADLPQYRERIGEVQQSLRQLPLAERVYMSMKLGAQERLPVPLDIRTEVGPAFDVIYRPVASGDKKVNDGTGLTLAALLTAKGFKEYFEPSAKDVTELAIIDQWVLGERQGLDYSEEDRKVLTGRIRALYGADYVDSWRRALNQFSVTDFSDLTHGVAVLEQVTGPAAPLRRLLETLHENTVIYPSEPLVEGNAPADVEQLQGARAGHQQAAGIRRAFVGLSEMLTRKGDQPSYYEETLRAVSAVYDYAKAVEDHPDRGKAALTAVLKRFSLGGPGPVANLQRIAVGLPEPVNQHVKKLADQTSQVLVIEALRELEKRWDAEIHSFYRERLANRYPFKAGSQDDASLEDFEAFFGPQGRLQQFHKQYLDAFIKDNIDALYSENLGGSLIRPEVLSQLKLAERIRDTFFNQRGALSVQLAIEPLALSNTRLSSVLSVDGQMIAYNHGPLQSTGLVWPNTLGNVTGTQLTLVHSTGNTATLSQKGPWSLFRLLSRGQLNGRTATSVDLTFVVADGVMRYRVSAEKTNNPITQRSFEGFVLPRTLLVDRSIGDIRKVSQR